MGRFNSLRIGHNNGGFGPAWHLEYVEVANQNTGESCIFPCRRCVGHEGGQGMPWWAGAICAWGRGCRAWWAGAMSVHGAGGAGPGGLWL